jgi:hypothetical protein
MDHPVALDLNTVPAAPPNVTLVAPVNPAA